MDARQATDGCMAVLLAGGRGTRLYELTARDCKPAVPFAGNRRIVDFAMANAARSRIGRLLVATQYRPDILSRHLVSQWGMAFPDGAMTLRDGAACGGYAATADAVAMNAAEIDAAAPRDLIVMAADHVCALDLSEMLAAHRRSGAEVTVAAQVVDRSEASAFGVLSVRDTGRATGFVEKPSFPPTLPGDPQRALASMGIYVFTWRWLRAVLAALPPGRDFGHDILPVAVAGGQVQVWRMPAAADGGPGYWRDVGTLDAYRLAQLDFQRATPCALPPVSAVADPASADPVRFGFEVVSGGLTLRAPRLRPDDAGRWAVLDGSVILPGAQLAPGVRLTRTIVAPGTVLPAGLVVGEDEAEDATWCRVSDGGTRLVTSGMLARRALTRPRPMAPPPRAALTRGETA